MNAAAEPRVVHAGHGHARAMGYSYRARIETKVNWLWDERWRFVGEYRHICWSDDGPGLPGGVRSRWFKLHAEAVAAANLWLDHRAYDPSATCEYVG